MKTDIIISGVGGQGILSISAVIGMAALDNDLHMKQAEVHGMSQRGGDVQSNLRISSEPIYSDLISLKGADLILSVEPMEALRYVPFLSESGWVVTNTTPFKNIDNYPSDEALMDELNSHPHVVLVDADAIAKDCGSARASNIVMLGAAAPFLGMPFEALEAGIRKIFGRKGEQIVDMNLKALRAGKEVAERVVANAQ
ncbi:indolepyruvate oxidoreductase subunit beta [Marinilabiliaceae bacterium JC017]|nr:indolepyruvate oxidoreductase subunit beta [Marinilabiliaceae bacterium JC017]